MYSIFRKPHFALTPKRAVIIVSSFAILAIGAFFFKDQIYNLATKGADPVAYWKFDEGQGSTAYDSIGSNNSTLATGNSAPTWVTEDQCISGKCLRFDGVNDRLTSMSSVGITGATSRTMSFWMNVKTAAGDSAGIGWGDLGFGQEFKAKVYQGEWYFWGYGSTYDIDTPTDINPSKWEHHTLVYNGATAYWYINGQLMTSKDMTLNTANTAFSISIPQESQTYFHALVDEVKIYDYARTASQIKTDYASRGTVNGTSVQFGDDDMSRKLSSGLVGYWKMDEVGVSGTNWTAVDSSGNNNNGTGAGNASVGTTARGKFGNVGFFDGGGDWIDLGSSLNMGTQHTLSFWLNYYNAGDAVVLGNANSQYAAYIDGPSSGGAIYYRPNPSSNYVSVVHGGLTQGIWYHFTIIRDGTQVTFYKNNTKLSTTQTLDSNYDMPIDCFGANCNSNGFPLYGFIDEIRFYNRVFDKSEIQAVYEFAPGPVGHWKMDEGVGSTAIDSSGNANSATLGTGNSAPIWTGGKFGKALDFDGNNDRIIVSDGGTSVLDLPLSFSIGMWINMNSFPGASNYDTLISKGTDTFDTNYYFELSGTDELDCGFSNGSYQTHETTAANLSTNNWHYISCVFDSENNTVKMYVNGVQVYTASETNTPVTGNASVYIGAESQTTQPIDGKIDDLRIYNYVRTPAQIMEDMNAGHPVIGTPVGSAVLDLKMNEGYGTTVNDASPQDNDGTFGTGTSAPSWTNEGKFGKALSFDGTSDYVAIPDNSELDFNNQDFTVSGWFYRDTSTTDDMIIAKRNGNAAGNQGFMVWVDDTTDKIDMEISDATDEYDLLSSSTFTTPGWNHFVIVWDDDDASNIEIYVNGKDDNATHTGTLANIGDLSTGNEIHLGNVSDGVSALNVDYYDGKLDEIKVYPFALTVDQVKQEYVGGKAIVLGAKSTGLGGTTPDNSSSRSYCVPGDSTTCSAPVGEWNFETVEGTTAYDTSTNGNNGTLTNAPRQTKGKFGKGLYFDGTNDYVDVGDMTSLEGVSQATWSFWIKGDAWNIGQIIMGKTNVTTTDISWLINHSSTTQGRLVITIAPSASDLTNYGYINSVLTGNEWKQITIVYNGSLTGNSNRLRLYINGVENILTYGGTIPATLRASSTNAVLGGISGATNYSVRGMMDEVRMYNYARTPAQIAWDYNRGAPVAYYDMNECTGTVVKDQAPNANGGFNGNTGTLTLGAGGVTSAGTCTAVASTARYNGATGKRDASISFDGTDDYVTIADNSSLDFTEGNNFSYSMWVKPTSLGANGTILAKKTGTGAGADGYMSLINTQGKVATYIADGTDSINKFTDATVSAGQWSYITVVYIDDTSLTMYINGKDGGGTLSGTIANIDDIVNASALVIGAESDAQVFRNGLIDEVKIYNYALTTAQIRTEMNSGTVRFE